MTQHFIDDLEIHIPVIEFIETIVTDRFREAPAGLVCGRLFLAAARIDRATAASPLD